MVRLICKLWSYFETPKTPDEYWSLIVKDFFRKYVSTFWKTLILILLVWKNNWNKKHLLKSTILFPLKNPTSVSKQSSRYPGLVSPPRELWIKIKINFRASLHLESASMPSSPARPSFMMPGNINSIRYLLIFSVPKNGASFLLKKIKEMSYKFSNYKPSLQVKWNCYR